jgi:hypothetical protein
VGVEEREGRSVYRLRVKGRLGLVGGGAPASVAKDLIVDALKFDILSVEDHPYPTYKSGGKPSGVAPREIDFGDFQVVKGVRLPFSISTKLHGQLTLSLRISDVTLNSQVSEKEFRIQK